MTATTGSEMVPYKEYAIAKNPDVGELMEVLRENVGASALSVFDLDRVKVPSGGGQVWSLPTLEGTPLDVRHLDGVIVYHRDPRAYWKVPFSESGGGTPPDCTAERGVHGIGDPGVECATCAFAQFGSKPLPPGSKKGTVSRGQACKQMKLVALLRPDVLLPTIVFCPPTSIKPVRTYLMGLASRATHFSSVVTRLDLEKDANADGLEYSKVTPRLLATLDASAAATIRAYSDSIKAVLDTIVVESSDLPAEEGGPTIVGYGGDEPDEQ